MKSLFLEYHGKRIELIVSDKQITQIIEALYPKDEITIAHSKGYQALINFFYWNLPTSNDKTTSK